MQVCNTEVTPEEMKLGVARGGAVSELVGEDVLLCGGRDTEGAIRWGS